MLFNSLSFGIFFPVVVFLYYLISPRFRVFLLFIASCIFYMAFVPKYILILFFLIVTDYVLAIQIDKNSDKKRKFLLVVSICTNLGTLFFFKYFNFFNQSVSDLASLLNWNYSPWLLSIALPLGLSFHVFQSLSYVIEVYKKNYKPERNLLHYGIYVMFFPQLVAGPIERPQHLLPQFNKIIQFDGQKIRKGLERMLWGFFKKLVIADQLALIVNPLFINLPKDGSSLILLAFLFAYQLYCDFSAYSDIAIGSALVLGFDLSENFDRPFTSRSVGEFWRKWHISLSNWLRDYLYYPLALGWGKVSKTRLFISLFITFVLIGLWHGANWTFAVFGGLQGVYLIFGSLTEKWRKKFRETTRLNRFPRLRVVIQVVFVFCLFSFSLIFFRSENMGQAWQFVYGLTHGLGDLFDYSFLRYQLFRGLGVGGIQHIPLYLSIVLVEVVQYYQSKKQTFYIFGQKSKFTRYSWYYALFFIIILFGYFGGQQFIYFQF